MYQKSFPLSPIHFKMCKRMHWTFGNMVLIAENKIYNFEKQRPLMLFSFFRRTQFHRFSASLRVLDQYKNRQS